MDSSEMLNETANQGCTTNEITHVSTNAKLSLNEQLIESTVKKLSRAKSRRLRRKKTQEIVSKSPGCDILKTSVTEKDLENLINDLEVLKSSDYRYYPSKSELKSVDTSINKIMAEKVDPKLKMDQKTREEIKAEREAKKLAKQQAKNKKTSIRDLPPKVETLTNEIKNMSIVEQKNTDVDVEVKSFVPNKDEVDRVHAIGKTIAPITEQTSEKSKAELKAERRAKQEAQRAAKSLNDTSVKTNDQKVDEIKSVSVIPKISKLIEIQTPPKKKVVKQSPMQHKVKLFNHLYSETDLKSLSLISTSIHPAVVQLGEQYRKGVIVGSNARCIAFLNALKIVIRDYETPPLREFSRELESFLKPCVNYLHQCRPISVSMTNALRFVKRHISQLPMNISDSDAKQKLQNVIDTYYLEQIHTAAKAISGFVQNKVTNGDVILIFGCSSLLQKILEDAQKSGIDFRVVVVDGRPALEGREMLRRLVDYGIKCSYVLINAISFIMGEVTKVLLGAHALLANGYVMSRVGTAQIAMVAHMYNVPVLVCCETHKFIERVQTDSFVYNEIGDPDKLVSSTEPGPLCGWIDIPTLNPLNLRYDVTPPALVTAVVTELAILPCTSVPVILRIRPVEIGF